MGTSRKASPKDEPISGVADLVPSDSGGGDSGGGRTGARPTDATGGGGDGRGKPAPTVPGWKPAVAAMAAATLFLVPLVATGELGLLWFDEPISNLAWDEGQVLPGRAGPAAGEQFGWELVVSLVLLPAILTSLVLAFASSSTPDKRNAASDEQQ